MISTDHIKYQRLKANMSQVELAQKLGITQPAVARLEMPGTYPKAGKLPEIADALSCSIDALFGRSPPSESHPKA